MAALSRDKLAGVWSATPTPFNDDMTLDEASVERMVEHHLRLGVKGLFLAGTCGEGAWMPDSTRRALVRATVKASAGRLVIAVQVTDNSSARILDNIAMAAEDGADVAVIAPPYFLLNATPDNILALYQEAIRDSSLPVGVYDRGKLGAVVVPDEVLANIYAEDNVVLVKDSSSDDGRRKIALEARRKRPDLLLLNGNEFKCVDYLAAGYDGLLLGGGIFNGYLAGLIMQAVKSGDLTTANALQERMNTMMYAVFGGESIACWLAGQKRLLVEMGIFSTWRHFLRYPLTPECEQDIKRIVKEEADVLFP
ncbi:MAG: dihydrodipicolinate synthase family protein [Armatimonadetes bacterium]|nr:dihydrodipicolinate synthase family protein [Armatimonadota bacterium]